MRKYAKGWEIFGAWQGGSFLSGFVGGRGHVCKGHVAFFRVFLHTFFGAQYKSLLPFFRGGGWGGVGGFVKVSLRTACCCQKDETLPYLWVNSVVPSFRIINLQNILICTRLITTPVGLEFVEVFWEIRPPLVPKDAGIVCISDRGVDVHCCTFCLEQIFVNFTCPIYLWFMWLAYIRLIQQSFKSFRMGLMSPTLSTEFQAKLGIKALI